jgi:aquaporin Z
MEAAGLGIFMVSACVFGSLLGHPGSPLHRAIASPLLGRVLMGLAMGATAIAIIYSPWGKQSGAHLNPAMTLTFLRLGKVDPRDAVFYIVFQLLGGIAGVAAAGWMLGGALSHPSVNYVCTLPGASGTGVAFAVEALISFILASVVLWATTRPRLGRFTGVFAGALVAISIAVAAPYSGMSMNPARSLGSAVPAQVYTALWIYFLAPPLGMQAAAALRLRRQGGSPSGCAKLHHQNSRRCIFCDYRVTRAASPRPSA